MLQLRQIKLRNPSSTRMPRGVLHVRRVRRHPLLPVMLMLRRLLLVMRLRLLVRVVLRLLRRGLVPRVPVQRQHAHAQPLTRLMGLLSVSHHLFSRLGRQPRRRLSMRVGVPGRLRMLLLRRIRLLPRRIGRV